MRRYLVITQVPNPDDDPTDTGNLYDAIGWWRKEGTGEYRDGEWHPEVVERDYKRGSMQMPVFEVGELLVVNEYGREINGLGRKPSKWDVEYEEFRSFTKAIARAVEVSFQ